MGQIAYRANLSSANYPMTISDGGRTVIIPGPDNNYDRRVDPTGQQLDAGIPQALYLENVMPTANGYQSVGYWTPSSPMTIPTPGATVSQVVDVRAKQIFVGPTLLTFAVINVPLYFWSTGQFTAGSYGTNTVTFVGAAPASARYFSTAVIAGVCYLYISDGGVGDFYTVEASLFGNLTFTNITATVLPLNFFTTNKIISVCGSNNYLIAHNNVTAYWSSTTTPTDFTSSLVSGAGSINPNNSDDALVYVKETLSGFYLYAENNILYAQYTGNARYPFKFVSVINSTGLFSGKRWEFYGQADTDGHYVIEKNKNIKFLQQSQTSPISPEVSDFLSKTPVQELLDYATNTFAAQIVSTETPKIYVHMNRYILVSINGTYIIVYDTNLKRYGKLKVPHTFMFCIWAPNEVIGFVDAVSSTIRYLNFDIFGTATPPLLGLVVVPITSALLLGKFQYVRARFLKVEGIEIEGPQNTAIVATPNFSCILLPSLDGRNFSAPVPLTASYLSGGVAKFPCHKTAQNISVLLKGAFNVNTLQLRFTPAGDR